MAAEVTTPTFRYVDGWPRMPEGQTFGQVVEIVVDSQDRVFIFHRGEISPLIFSREGDYLGTWQDTSHWVDIHGVCIDRDEQGEYLIVVDRDGHFVSRCDLDGNVAWTIGEPGTVGADGEPFNRPTDAAIAPNGDIYVSDGYGNSAVHRFNANGEQIQSWGTAGAGAGQFNLPHSVRIIESDGEPLAYVCDRENWRIQKFTLDGELRGEIAPLSQPADIVVDSDGVRYIPELRGRVTLLNPDDSMLIQIGGEQKKEPDHFVAPHTLWLDSEGSFYVGEVLEGQRVSKYRRQA